MTHLDRDDIRYRLVLWPSKHLEPAAQADPDDAVLADRRRFPMVDACMRFVERWWFELNEVDRDVYREGERNGEPLWVATVGEELVAIGHGNRYVCLTVARELEGEYVSDEEYEEVFSRVLGIRGEELMRITRSRTLTYIHLPAITSRILMSGRAVRGSGE